MNTRKKEIFSKNLKYYMKLKGKSRKDIEDDTGIPYNSIRDYEKGYCYAKLSKIKAIAECLGVSIPMLTEEHDIDGSLHIVDDTEESKLLLNIKNIIYNSEDSKLLYKCLSELSKLDKQKLKYILTTIDMIK